MMSTENTGGLLQLQGSPIDDLVRFEDRGVRNKRRWLVPHLASSAERGIHWRPLAVKPWASFPDASSEDGLEWPVWRFPVSHIDVGIRAAVAEGADTTQVARWFGDPIASRIASDHAAVWLEFSGRGGRVTRWSHERAAEFANATFRAPAVMRANVAPPSHRADVQVVMNPRRQVGIGIDTKRLVENDWIVGVE